MNQRSQIPNGFFSKADFMICFFFMSFEQEGLKGPSLTAQSCYVEDFWMTLQLTTVLGAPWDLYPDPVVSF